jgi:hypothetical protein
MELEKKNLRLGGTNPLVSASFNHQVWFVTLSDLSIWFRWRVTIPFHHMMDCTKREQIRVQEKREQIKHVKIIFTGNGFK